MVLSEALPWRQCIGCAIVVLVILAPFQLNFKTTVLVQKQHSVGLGWKATHKKGVRTSHGLGWNGTHAKAPRTPRNKDARLRAAEEWTLSAGFVNGTDTCTLGFLSEHVYLWTMVRDTDRLLMEHFLRHYLHLGVNLHNQSE
eukprot:2745940-Amphidinium_carterae.1